MDGIILINKDKGMTSRDVVNEVSKILHTSKVGHTGTLDPNASGLLVLCVGKATKLVEILIDHDKEYIAEATLGIMTSTLDTDSPVIAKQVVMINKKNLIEVLNSFVGSYEQEVPIYSAKKIKGKKLYEYARAHQTVNLPTQVVDISKIELLSFNNHLEYPKFSFKVVVSKGTYIRSLIRDIANTAGTIGIMSDLKRTRVGLYNLSDAYTIEDVRNGNYKIISLNDILICYPKVKVDDILKKQIDCGAIIDNIYNLDFVVFIDNQNNVLAIYKRYSKNKNKLKPWKMFI